MVIALATKPGINGANTLSIPKDWDATWFRKFIANSLKGADVRNAVGANGISVTGTIASPYATISIGSGPIVINTAAGTVALTVNGVTGQASAVFNGTPILINLTSGNQIALNSVGADFGIIGNPSAQVWGLGYSTGVLTPSATYALEWDTTGKVYMNTWASISGVQTITASSGLQITGSTITGKGAISGSQIDIAPDFATWTGTLTGVTGTVTGTVTMRKMGQLANLTCTITGTSNATTCTLTGLPAAWQPATRQLIATAGGIVDNGVRVSAYVDILPGNSAITFAMGTNFSTTGFTAAGSKGPSLLSVTYALLN